tara:strand:- start:301 stop:411 length:111 start_codon:yes stop_codon:yes gene_type:complete
VRPGRLVDGPFGELHVPLVGQTNSHFEKGAQITHAA